MEIGRIQAANPAGLEDEVLVKRFRKGDGEALNFLLHRYQRLVRAMSSRYFLRGADREDIFQEGMLGLYKAIRDFKEEKGASFKSFASLCINRQLITAVKISTRQKHAPLNTSISLNKPLNEEDKDCTLLDIIPGDNGLGPEEMIIGQERANDLAGKIISMLSGLERKVLALYLDGLTYEEMSEHLKQPLKAIDNALQRVKRKLSRFMEEKKSPHMLKHVFESPAREKLFSS
ncbi:RNA polymerase sporulation sigma factor SigH [Heyndrickxia acidicola]|uniref:RNA polymerase sporulation sigma factor SigH n=1 Tax=Heyndrickxia acidicola TaxID=209389 RepID=UPI00399CAB11